MQPVVEVTRVGVSRWTGRERGALTVLDVLTMAVLLGILLPRYQGRSTVTATLTTPHPVEPPAQ
jgi:hypothetical protein